MLASASSSRTETLISLVEIMWMLMSASYRALKHLGGHAGVVDHAGADDRDLHDALIHVDVVKGQAALVGLQQGQGLVHVAAADGEADVLGSRPGRWTGG